MPRATRLTVFIRGLLLVVVMGSLSGCGTIFSQRNYWFGIHKSIPGPVEERQIVVDGVWVYGGTQTDINAMNLFSFLPLIDLPFSIAADTALLPLTVTQQIVGRPSSVKDSEEQEGKRDRVDEEPE